MKKIIFFKITSKKMAKSAMKRHLINIAFFKTLWLKCARLKHLDFVF